ALAVLCQFLLFAARPAHAQFDSATVSGIVQDSTGGVLPGVDVTLTSTGTGLERRTVTNDAGLYTFPNVPVGQYSVKASISGFNTFGTGVTSINGGRSDEFITTVDGAPSIRVRAAGGFMMGAQNFDTVEEVQVLTSNYQAEFGRSSAGQLRLVTKSGSQKFRGNVFWSAQNDALDTNTWSHVQAGLPKSPHTYNAWGFTLCGPLYIPGAFNTSKQKLL